MFHIFNYLAQIKTKSTNNLEPNSLKSHSLQTSLKCEIQLNKTISDKWINLLTKRNRITDNNLYFKSLRHFQTWKYFKILATMGNSKFWGIFAVHNSWNLQQTAQQAINSLPKLILINFIQKIQIIMDSNSTVIQLAVILHYSKADTETSLFIYCCILARMYTTEVAKLRLTSCIWLV